MKAAVLIDTWFPFVGGGQINAYEISRLIAQKGVVIDIITRNCGNDTLQKVKNINYIKLGKISNPLSPLAKVFFMFNSFLYISTRNYDLVNAHAFLPGITARLISVFRGVPSIMTVHGTSIGTSLNGRITDLVEKFILTDISYNAQITVSRDFFKIKNINKNIHFIPNAVSLDLFNKVSAKKPAHPTIIFVGRLHPQKNILTLVQAVAELKKTIPDIRLIVVGSGKQKSQIRKDINKYHLSKNTKLTGEIRGRDLIKLYKSSHLLVLPSIYEGQPLAVLEAWAAKIPVIASKTGDSQYLVRDGVNGYLLNDPLDVMSLAKTISKALTGKKLSKMGTNGYNYVQKNLSWSNSAELTLKVYQNVTKTLN